METKPARILVIGPSWVGDMVMAQSLFKILKQENPDADIDVLAPAWSKPLLARMPEVNQAIAMPLQHGHLGLRVRYHLGLGLRDKQYQQAILLPNSWKSALVPFWAKIPQRTGFLGEWRWGWLNDIRPLPKIRLPMTVQRFVALGLARGAALPSPLPRPMLKVASQNVATALQRHALDRPTAPVLGLCPGAEYGPAKRWPADYFAEISRRKLAAGWAVWIFGSAKDTTAGREVAARSGKGCVDLTGKTTLAEAIDLLSLTTVVVSNDSGLMHVAAALDRPLVAIYGSSDPHCTPPLSANAQTLSLQLACSPCFQRCCPLGHLKCLRDLPSARVIGAIEQAVA